MNKRLRSKFYTYKNILNERGESSAAMEGFKSSLPLSFAKIHKRYLKEIKKNEKMSLRSG